MINVLGVVKNSTNKFKTAIITSMSRDICTTREGYAAGFNNTGKDYLSVYVCMYSPSYS